MVLVRSPDLFVEFLDKKLFPFLISVRNEHFNPKTDLDFCNEFLHNVITFVEQLQTTAEENNNNLDFYLYSVANSQPFFEFIQFIGLEIYLYHRACSLLQSKNNKFIIQLITSFLKKFKRI